MRNFDDNGSGPRACPAPEGLGMAAPDAAPDLCIYIADMVQELQELAEEAKLDRLSVVLDVAYREALTQAAILRRPRRTG